MLSLGEQQRLGIARALLHAPDFLFLDEATASLDEPSEATLYRLLRRAARRTPPSCRSAIARRLRRSTGAGWRSPAKAIITPCGRRASRRPAKRDAQTQQKEKGRRPMTAAALSGTDVSSDLLQAAEREVGRQLGDEGRTAPVGAGADD